MEILEIGSRARSALAVASRVDTIMTFSRGHVLRTDRSDIIWCDSDYEAFSPCGVRIPAWGLPPNPDTLDDSGKPNTITPPRSGRSQYDFVAALDEAVDRACASFTAAMRNGVSIGRAAKLVIGLGRGLTPAGDDFLGGFLVVSHRRGYRKTLDISMTHPISQARLAMHMRGEGTRAELGFVSALLAGADREPASKALHRHGQSSGADFMRGALAAAAVP